LDPDQILDWRIAGKTYNQIAELTGASYWTIQRFCASQLPSIFRFSWHHASARAKVEAILDIKGDDNVTLEQLATWAGCKPATAANYRAEYRRGLRSPSYHIENRHPVERCQFCDIAENAKPSNPLINGFCLWCWSYYARINLRELFEQIGVHDAIKLLTQEPDHVKCAYCQFDAITPIFVTPPMCRQHFEIAYVSARIQKKGREPTPDTIWGEKEALNIRLTINHDQIDELMESMI
jgi:hypothetical protein